MATLNERLARLERHHVPGGLPLVLIAADGPAGDAVRQQAQRLRDSGQQVILIAPGGDAMGELAELFV
ncbi:MAG: hypothetical protein IPG98_14925 [Burkholderiales bacterium]|nr:hypothetical protein [Burkholderiales bacterium]MBK8667109.1 hypothetical protein [Burkholderiales bacterium]